MRKIGRPPTPKCAQRTQAVTVRFTTRQLRLVREAAKRAGCPLATYLCLVALKAAWVEVKQKKKGIKETKMQKIMTKLAENLPSTYLAVEKLAREAAREAIAQGATCPWGDGDTCSGGDWDALYEMLGRPDTVNEYVAWDRTFRGTIDLEAPQSDADDTQ